MCEQAGGFGSVGWMRCVRLVWELTVEAAGVGASTGEASVAEGMIDMIACNTRQRFERSICYIGRYHAAPPVAAS